MTRETAHDVFDATIELWGKDLPDTIVGLVKETYAITDSGLQRAPAVPLTADPRDPDNDTPLRPGGDYWWQKPHSDMIVLGSAHAPTAVPRHEVGLSVGSVGRRITVWGRRVVSWKPGSAPTFSAPEPLTEVPLTYDNAYGGYDPRVPAPAPEDLGTAMQAAGDHPGLYPRNPFGRGYVVVDEPADGIELPALEDPDDPVTPERFVVGDPRNWYRQPAVAGFGWRSPLMFPRYLHTGVDAWYPGPQDASMPEVRSGLLPANYRTALERGNPLKLEQPGPGFYQEAAPGLVFSDLVPGTPISVRGMHPEGRRVSFALPDRPTIEVELESERWRVPPKLLHVVLEPEQARVTLTYAAVHTEFSRRFIPGIHTEIPLRMRVQGVGPIEYRTPPTVLEQAAAAEQSTSGPR